jgi:hypothetical protein
MSQCYMGPGYCVTGQNCNSPATSSRHWRLFGLTWRTEAGERWFRKIAKQYGLLITSARTRLYVGRLIAPDFRQAHEQSAFEIGERSGLVR